MQDRPWNKFWIQGFKKSRRHGHKRFKRLETGYPPFEINEELIDIVSLEDFIRIEKDRLPLFIGSQFGINPRINEIPGFFNGRKQIAILAKSLLSGSVSGLTLYQIKRRHKEFKFNKIAFFR
jgi:hypothetical protein